jgi:hypothetical protein
MWVAPNPKIQSSYLLDNVELDESETFRDSIHIDKIDDSKDKKYGKNEVIDNKVGSSTNQNLADLVHSISVESNPIMVRGNHIYNYSMTVKEKNTNHLFVAALFKKSADIVKNTTKYGNHASGGAVLSLSPKSSISTVIDILKPSNYSVAVKAKACMTCTYLRFETRQQDNESEYKILNTAEVSLKDNKTGLKWVNSNTMYLKKGIYELRIYSDSNTDIDSVVVYDDDRHRYSLNHDKKGIVAELFNNQKASPAVLSEYEKVDPTKYIINIKNASRPYFLSLAEGYDPLWVAHTISDSHNSSKEKNNFKTSSIPLYSVVNGFRINQTGDYTLVLEYLPQEWFTRAGLVSLLGLALMPVIFLISQYMRLSRHPH